MTNGKAWTQTAVWWFPEESVGSKRQMSQIYSNGRRLDFGW